MTRAYHRWTPEQDALIVAARASGVPLASLVAAVGHPINSVIHRSTRLVRDGRMGRLTKSQRSRQRRIPNAVARFWSFIDRSSPGGCWPWVGAKGRRGYGRVTWRILGQLPDAQAHRIAFLLSNGYLPPDGEVVRHTCDNPPCCKPDHLIPGTVKDNMDDAIARGRLNPARGESHVCAKLTDVTVLEARSLRAAGWAYGRIAAKFRVNQRTIREACLKNTWAHVG